MYYLLTEVLCNSSCIWAPIGIIWQKMTLQKYLIKLEFTKRTTDITGFLLAQDATVCNFFPPVLRWRNVTVQLLFLIMNIFILLIKVITFLIPVSPTANRQIKKPEFTIQKITLQFFCTEVIARFWSDTDCVLFEEWIYTLSLKEQLQKGMTVFAFLQMPPHFY